MSPDRSQSPPASGTAWHWCCGSSRPLIPRRMAGECGTERGEPRDGARVHRARARMSSWCNESASASAREGNTTAIIAEADGYVRAGKKGFVYSKNKTIETKDDNSGNTRLGYIRFDLARAKRGAIKSASIQLTCRVANSEGGRGQMFAVERDDWQETKLSWNTKPSRGQLLATWPRPTAGDRLEIDVTDFVKKEVRGDRKLSVCVYVKGYHGISYASKEDDDVEARPTLVLVME